MQHWTPQDITALVEQIGVLVGAVTLLWKSIHGQKEVANNAIEHLSTSVPMETVAAMQAQPPATEAPAALEANPQ